MVEVVQERRVNTSHFSVTIDRYPVHPQKCVVFNHSLRVYTLKHKRTWTSDLERNLTCEGHMDCVGKYIDYQKSPYRRGFDTRIIGGCGFKDKE